MSKNRNRNRGQQITKQEQPSAPQQDNDSTDSVDAEPKKPKTTNSYSEMLKARAEERKQRALKFRKDGEA